MPTFLTRIFAVLLVPCLVLDPVLALGFTAAPSRPSSPALHAFTNQALIGHLVAAYRKRQDKPAVGVVRSMFNWLFPEGFGRGPSQDSGVRHWSALKLAGDHKPVDPVAEVAAREGTRRVSFGAKTDGGVEIQFEMTEPEWTELREAFFSAKVWMPNGFQDLWKDAVNALEQSGVDLTPLKKGKKIVFALMERESSQHLFEDHQPNNILLGRSTVGFIGLNRTLLDLAHKDPHLARALFIAGLAHELRHEAGLEEESEELDALTIIRQVGLWLEKPEPFEMLREFLPTGAFIQALEETLKIYRVLSARVTSNWSDSRPNFDAILSAAGSATPFQFKVLAAWLLQQHRDRETSNEARQILVQLAQNGHAAWIEQAIVPHLVAYLPEETHTSPKTRSFSDRLRDQIYSHAYPSASRVREQAGSKEAVETLVALAGVGTGHPLILERRRAILRHLAEGSSWAYQLLEGLTHKRVLPALLDEAVPLLAGQLTGKSYADRRSALPLLRRFIEHGMGISPLNHVIVPLMETVLTTDLDSTIEARELLETLLKEGIGPDEFQKCVPDLLKASRSNPWAAGMLLTLVDSDSTKSKLIAAMDLVSDWLLSPSVSVRERTQAFLAGLAAEKVPSDQWPAIVERSISNLRPLIKIFGYVDSRALFDAPSKGLQDYAGETLAAVGQAELAVESGPMSIQQMVSLELQGDLILWAAMPAFGALLGQPRNGSTFETEFLKLLARYQKASDNKQTDRGKLLIQWIQQGIGHESLQQAYARLPNSWSFFSDYSEILIPLGLQPTAADLADALSSPANRPQAQAVWNFLRSNWKTLPADLRDVLPMAENLSEPEWQYLFAIMNDAPERVTSFFTRVPGENRFVPGPLMPLYEAVARAGQQERLNPLLFTNAFPVVEQILLRPGVSTLILNLCESGRAPALRSALDWLTKLRGQRVGLEETRQRLAAYFPPADAAANSDTPAYGEDLLRFLTEDDNQVMAFAKRAFVDTWIEQNQSQAVFHYVESYLSSSVPRTHRLEYLRGVHAILLHAGSDVRNTLEDWRLLHEDYIPRFGYLADRTMLRAHRLLARKTSLDHPDVVALKLPLLGVTQTGVPGIQQLERVIPRYTQRIIRHGYIDERWLEHPLIVALVGKLTGFSSAVWGHGSHRRIPLKTFVTEFNAAVRAGKIAPLHEAFKKAATFVVRKKGAVQFSKNATDKFAEYQDLIDRSAEIARLNPKEQYAHFQISALHLFEEAQKTMEASLSKPELNDWAAQAITKQIESLKTIQVSLKAASSGDLVDLIRLLRPQKQSASLLPSLLIVTLMNRVPAMRTTLPGRLHQGIAEGLPYLLEMRDDMLPQHVLTGFKPDEVRDLLSSISTRIFEDEIARIEVSWEGALRVRAIATRGILAEMAGDLGDACYTSVREIMQREHPSRITGVAFQTEEGGVPRFAGSMLFLENTVKGQPVLILRAINAAPDLMATHSAQDFVNGVLEYAEAIARARGATLIAPLGAHGALSNRPDILAVFRDFVSGDQVQLDRTENFNGYDLRDACFPVSSKVSLFNNTSYAVRYEEAFLPLMPDGAKWTATLPETRAIGARLGLSPEKTQTLLAPLEEIGLLAFFSPRRWLHVLAASRLPTFISYVLLSGSLEGNALVTLVAVANTLGFASGHDKKDQPFAGAGGLLFNAAGLSAGVALQHLFPGLSPGVTLAGMLTVSTLTHHLWNRWGHPRKRLISSAA
jgi:hypothetical protein